MKRFLIPTAILSAAGLLASCAPSPKQEAAGGSAAPAADVPLAACQTELLELAFSGVSAMPLRPHIKNRSRAQLRVVEACLELDQPARAAAYIEEIANWQRWMGYAELAAWFAEQGRFEESAAAAARAEAAVKLADDLRTGRIAAAAANPLIDTLKEWRYEAVLTRLEEVRRLNAGAALRAADEKTYGEVNAAELNIERAAAGKASARAAVEALRPFTAHANFEVVYHGLMQLADTAAAHYEEIDLPQLLADEVVPKLDNVPVFLKTDIYVRFAEAAVQNGDAAGAEPLLQELDVMVGGLESRPLYYIPEAAKVIRLRHALGQAAKARTALDEALALFDARREFIVNIERAGLICEMAALYGLLGDTPMALRLYGRAVSEGRVNPNARPQADDLSRICLSMAVSAVEPTLELMSDLKAMQSALGAPW